MIKWKPLYVSLARMTLIRYTFNIMRAILESWTLLNCRSAIHRLDMNYLYQLNKHFFSYGSLWKIYVASNLQQCTYVYLQYCNCIVMCQKAVESSNNDVHLIEIVVTRPTLLGFWSRPLKNYVLDMLEDKPFTRKYNVWHCQPLYKTHW